VILPVPWEVTVSYGAGTAAAPEAILEASKQVDLFEPDFPGGWKVGIAMTSMPKGLKQKSAQLRRKAVRYIGLLGSGKDPTKNVSMKKMQKEINAGCKEMIRLVHASAQKLLEDGKLIALLGGDHSTPLGLIQAVGERYGNFGILHIDAHADLREAYEGFTYSHASIMYNVLKEVPSVSKIVQVGIRDFCDEELAIIEKSNGRVVPWFDRDIRQRMFNGKALMDIQTEIISQLPQQVHVSFDIDGLDPALCPHTGTPVPGGLGFEEATNLLRLLADSGRTIISCDLNEVSPRIDEWDANVGSRILYRMVNMMAKSNG
jgi:agmatinase